MQLKERVECKERYDPRLPIGTNKFHWLKMTPWSLLNDNIIYNQRQCMP